MRYYRTWTKVLGRKFWLCFPLLKMQTTPVSKWQRKIGVAGESGVDAALLDGESHAIDSQHVGGNAVVHAVRL